MCKISQVEKSQCSDCSLLLLMKMEAIIMPEWEINSMNTVSSFSPHCLEWETARD